jgi:hypothetical protein
MLPEVLLQGRPQVLLQGQPQVLLRGQQLRGQQQEEWEQEWQQWLLQPLSQRQFRCPQFQNLNNSFLHAV